MSSRSAFDVGVLRTGSHFVLLRFEAGKRHPWDGITDVWRLTPNAERRTGYEVEIASVV